MNAIDIQHLGKNFGSTPVLQDISLAIAPGRFVALVGPSGCGKSTLLRTIAGLESTTTGSLCIDGVVVNEKPPRERDVAMVFQSYALYPHMDVARNMGYSLRLKKAAQDVVAQAIDGVAKTLGLQPLLARFPRELSGGQRQRVAMGRAIVRRPKVFLFDEPLSNLDAALRVHMRGEIRKLHRRLGATSVYVTHDQIEAMTMADEVVVMRAGRIEQVGAPLALYATPANKFVAGFIGSPAMNFIEATVGADGAHAVLAADKNLHIALGRPRVAGLRVWLGLRPEHLRLDTGAQPLPAVVAAVETTGSQSFVALELCGHTLTLAQAGTVGLREGDAVTLGIAPEHVHVFDFGSEAAL